MRVSALRRGRALGVVAGLWMATGAFAQAAPTDRNIAPSDPALLAREAVVYRDHLFTLADPLMEGRAPGTLGNRLAAAYLEMHVNRLGLLPAFPGEGADGTVKDRISYRQEFQPTGARPPYGKAKLPLQVVAYGEGDARVELKPDTDFKVLGYSADGEVTGPLAFAGYSIDDGEDDYTSFPGRNLLAGKIAIVLRFEPMNDEGRSQWVSRGWSANAALDGKLRAAADQGASGIILVNPPGANDPRVGELSGLELSGRAMRVPVVMMSQEAADALVRAADPQGRSLLDLRRLADKDGGVIDLPGVPVSLGVKIERPSTFTDNVGAILPGRGALANEWIVIGSHYDHVGYGPVGARPENYGKVHAGADDNASGSTGVLMVASRLARAYAASNDDARSVLFLWFSAEESGLEGARHFVANPIMDLADISIMINLDMIGRLRDGRLEVGGVGSARGLEEWLAPYWDASGLNVRVTRLGAPNSDHFAFQARDVANLFFFTGLHREYHTPADLPETVNIEGAVQIADLVARIALDAAKRSERFRFGSGEPVVREESPNRPAMAGLRVRFGIMPGDYDAADGVLVGDLSGPDTPAAKAGLKAGDIMLRWNGEKLTDVAQWMGLMSKNNPGDEVEIVYRRDGEEHTTKATLVAGGRRQPQ